MAISDLDLGAVKKVGFNSAVHLADRTLHIQTEILTRDGIVIRTIVLEGGVAKFSEGRPCPPDISDLDSFVALVEAQHNDRVERVRREAGA